MMDRDLSRLTERELDLLVVGAGVYGAAAAWDASLRGLSVALVDKADFGSATSFNNLKTVHGGLRYLQHADLRRMRESIRERRILMGIAPHLVHPLPFLLPTYRDWKRSRSALTLALFLNDLVGFDRNRLGDPDKHIPAGRLISGEECRELVPGVEEKGLTGGALWYDAQMVNSDRLTLCFVLSAAEAGAQVANYVEVIGFLREGARVRGVRARDGLSGETLDIRSRVVLNASGPWVDRVLGFLASEARRRLFHFSKAMNLVTRLLPNRIAVGLACKHPRQDRHAMIGTRSRFLFVIPWREHSLIGTSHARYEGDPDTLEASERDVQDLLDDVNTAYPAGGLGRHDVRLIHRGLLPMVQGTGGRGGVTLVKKYTIEDHRREGIDGLVTLVGVKYTTARDVAEKAVDLVFDVLGKRPPRSRSARTPLRGGHIERFSEFLSREVRKRPQGLDEAVIGHLVRTYGSVYPEILSYLKEDPSLGRSVKAGSAVLAAEVVHAVREEQALDLASVVMRRTELGSAGHPGRATLETVAEIMKGELGWNADRTQREIESVEDLYRLRS